MSQSDLGPVIGGVEPMKPIRKPLLLEDGQCAAQRAAWIVLGFVLTFAGSAVIALLWVLYVFFPWPALAHGSAEWIQRGGYKNAVGELCCGPRDCMELTDADVKVTPAGYFVVRTKETIPFDQATPSPTGSYWRCAWGGERKCFFAPPGST